MRDATRRPVPDYAASGRDRDGVEAPRNPEGAYYSADFLLYRSPSRRALYPFSSSRRNSTTPAAQPLPGKRSRGLPTTGGRLPALPSQPVAANPRFTAVDLKVVRHPAVFGRAASPVRQAPHLAACLQYRGLHSATGALQPTHGRYHLAGGRRADG